jgi:hypothetical protein
MPTTISPPGFEALDAAVADLKQVAGGWSTAYQRNQAIDGVLAALKPFESWNLDKTAFAIADSSANARISAISLLFDRGRGKAVQPEHIRSVRIGFVDSPSLES